MAFKPSHVVRWIFNDAPTDHLYKPQTVLIKSWPRKQANIIKGSSPTLIIYGHSSWNILFLKNFCNLRISLKLFQNSLASYPAAFSIWKLATATNRINKLIFMSQNLITFINYIVVRQLFNLLKQCTNSLYLGFCSISQLVPLKFHGESVFRCDANSPKLRFQPQKAM